MSNKLEQTHRRFKIDPFKWQEVVASCKKNFGDTDHMQQYHLRPWITNEYALHIRNDLLDDTFVTYLGLVCDLKKPA